MKILFIAPLPPPTGGHSLAARVLFEHLRMNHEIVVVNLNRDSLRYGEVTFGRIIEVLGILKDVWCKGRGADAIYLTISESFAGNLKDLFIYSICWSRLSKMYIHLHGGSIRKLLFNRNRLILALNKVFLVRLGGAIVLGPSHLEVFEDLVSKERVHVVPNFAEDYLFSSKKEIKEKFANRLPLRILFVSNLVKEKGYRDLVDAYFSLDKGLRKMVRIDLAGRFGSEREKTAFLSEIRNAGGIEYHGVVDGAIKKRLFAEAHAVCLPTSLLEGQPIAILEAYAGGCVVLATRPPGISDIFRDGVNGFEIRESSSDAVKAVLEQTIGEQERLLEMAIYNREIAGEKYRARFYVDSLEKILEGGRAGDCESLG